MKELKILKTDTYTVFKFYEDERKFRIDFYDGLFHLWATKRNFRYFHHVESFVLLSDAKNFIYTHEAFDLMPD